MSSSLRRILASRANGTRSQGPSTPDTAENPRIVASFPGSPTIRARLGSSSDISLSPSPFARIPSFRTNPVAFLRNSPLCRALGLTTSVRLSGVLHAWWAAFAAVIVDFPHCLVQFSSPLLLVVPSTRACKASAGNCSSSLTHAVASPVRTLRAAGRLRFVL